MANYAAYIILAIACIELGEVFDLNWVIIASVLGTLIAIIYLFKSRLMIVQYGIIAILSILLLVRAGFAAIPDSFTTEEYTGEALHIQAVVDESPQRNQYGANVVLNKVVLIDNLQLDWVGKIQINIPFYSDVAYGDTIEVRGVFEDYTQFKDEGYRSYLYHHQILGQIKWPEISVIKRGGGNALIARGLDIQQAANHKFNSLLPQDEAAFLSGVVLGSRQLTTEGFSDSLKKTGTNHLIVASGYNISILVSLVLKTNKFLGKTPSLIIVLIMIACYTFISGLDPSIIRASIMAGLGLLAISFGRQKQAMYLTLLAGYIMLFVNPSWLYDVGFQLSFSATLGIITLQPFLQSKLTNIPVFFREALSTTVAAQLFVYPILIVSFGQISIISLITNLLVVWVIPLIMFTGMTVVMLAFIIPVFAQFISILMYPLLLYIKNCIQITSNIPFAVLSLDGFSWLTASAYYAALYYLLKIRLLYEERKSL